MNSRGGKEEVTTSASLPWQREERQPGRQLRCHEGIAAADVAAEVLRRITIHELTTKHRMSHATDFMLNGEQLTAGLRVDDILEAILIVIAFLGDQTMLLQEGVRTREVGDVHGKVVPVIFRNFRSRFAENEALLGTDLHPHGGGIHVLRQSVRSPKDFFVELSDTGGSTGLHREFD